MKRNNLTPYTLKRRCMMLMEIIISMVLMVLCILPLITPHIAMVKEQKKLNATMQLDHVVHLFYVDMLEQLQKNKIPWSQIQEEKEMPINDDMWRRIGFDTQLPVKGFYRFKEIRHKPKKTAAWNAHWLSLTFYFIPENSSIGSKSAELSFPYELTLLRHTQIEEEIEPGKDGTQQGQQAPSKPQQQAGNNASPTANPNQKGAK